MNLVSQKRLLQMVLLGVLIMGSLASRAEPPGPSSRRTSLVISEIMYHPALRNDGKNLEYIEIFNSEAVPQDLSGYRLTGDADFVFPAGSVIAPLGYFVVAPAPPDVARNYGLANVYGPFGNGTNSLPNDAGTIRLRSKSGAVLLEVEYADESPWPVAADGAGHSLVLSRPSLGEGDPEAWAASKFIGGSPGAAEPQFTDPFDAVFINEFLAHTDEPSVDYVELYNHSNQSLSLEGCVLTDDPVTNKFVLPSNTIIPAQGFVSFTQNELGFALSAAGETLYLKNVPQTRVLDAVRFGAQANGVAAGRYPDGNGQIYPLLSHTKGTPNSGIRISDVVINELMYHPISGDSDDQFVELYNRTATPVHLAGWKLGGTISFTFASNTVIAPNGYFVAAKNAAQLLTNYPNLSPSNTAGDFKSKLAGGGGRVTLSMPDTIIVTNKTGVVTNTIHVVVDETTYHTGGRWGQWSDGGGSSLELIDGRANHRLAASWADSDESAKAPWTLVESTGVLDNGVGTPDQLQILLQGIGECLVDEVEVVNPSLVNVISNPSFENGLTGWVAEGTHEQTSFESTEGYNSARSLHVRAVGRGDTGANRIRSTLTSNLTPGTTATIRARVRWLRGHPEVLLRLRGNYLEAIGSMSIPRQLGTPGARNSRAAGNAGPAIYEVNHAPVLPAANQAVIVTARVQDPDGLSSVRLSYRIDPSTAATTLAMADDGTGGDAIAGDGIFSATIPGRAAGTLIAFTVQATDSFSPSATTQFPNDSPVRECLIRFGETQPTGPLGTYRLWMTQATASRWASRSKLHNGPLDVTFVYNDQRIIYNMNALYAGSPYIAPGYNTPSGGLCGYTGSFPEDDRFLGTTDFVLDWPGRDNSALEEQASYWIADQIGLPNSYRRFIHLHVNGVTDQARGSVYEDVQQPGSDMIKEWVPNDTEGSFYKIERWFEFSDSGSLLSDPQPRLQVYTTTGGAKKLARYRWNWQPRAVKNSVNDYTSLFALVDAVNAPAPEPYTSQTESLADMEEMMGIFAVERMVNNFDSWGHEIGKNLYAYKPDGGKWITFMFDIDWVMRSSAGHNNYGPTSALFTPCEDPVVSRMYNHPPFRRAWFRSAKKAVDGPMAASAVNPWLDAKYAALVAGGVTRSANQALIAPAPVKTWISQRRDYLLQQLQALAAPFAITSNNGLDFNSSTNAVTLTGTAPIEVVRIRINGEDYPLTWTTVTNWAAKVALSSAANRFAFEAVNYNGAVIPGGTRAVSVFFTGAIDAPDKVVINEIMYNPVAPNASFVELFNSSATTSFDISNWRLDGADFSFPPGSIVPPGGFQVIAKDRGAFAAAYGNSIPLAGEFSGQLKNSGETLSLLRPGANNGESIVVRRVTYSDSLPWPSAADGQGSSLQLIDPGQDNSRVANWAAAQAGVSNSPPQSLLGIAQSWKYFQSSDPGPAWPTTGFNDSAWPSGAALLYVEGAALPAPKNTPLTIGRTTYYFRTHFNFTGDPAGKSLRFSTVLDDGAVFYLNGVEIYRLGMPSGVITDATFSDRLVGDAAYEGPFTVATSALQRGDNLLAVEVHQNNTTSSDIVFGMTLESFVPTIDRSFTPGAVNSVASTLPPFPLLWINELMPLNLTGISDNAGQREPWLEIYNSGTSAVTLDGWFLTDDFTNLTRWAFPAGTAVNSRQFLTVWLDGEPNQAAAGFLHASFRARPDAGSVALVFPFQSKPAVLDYVTYSFIPADHSYGLFPDGQPGARQIFSSPSPALANNNAAPALPLFINEWMASNTSTLADAADGNFDDWFEIYNPNPTTVDLSGYSLADTLTNSSSRWMIPPGTRIGPHALLLIWADGDTGQNGPTNELHASFQLNKGGESIGLFAPNGSVVDSVTFGAQTNDASQGRWPDGAPDIQFMPPTPRLANAPFAQSSALRIVEARATHDGNLTLTWTAQAGAIYRVEARTSFNDPGWAPVLDVRASGDFASATIALAQKPSQYFRIQIVPP